MRTTIIVILIFIAIIKCGKSERNCGPGMTRDKGKDGILYCRPAICKSNKCVEHEYNETYCENGSADIHQNCTSPATCKNNNTCIERKMYNVTCENMAGNQENCTMLIDWKLKSKEEEPGYKAWINLDYSCAMQKGQLKYVDGIIVQQKCEPILKNAIDYAYTPTIEVCKNVESCEINLEKCNESVVLMNMIIICQAIGKIPIENEIEEISVTSLIAIKISRQGEVLNNREVTMNAGDIITCEIEKDQLDASAGVIVISQVWKSEVVHYNVCTNFSCTLDIVSFIQRKSQFTIECFPRFKFSSFKAINELLTQRFKLCVLADKFKRKFTYLVINNGNLKSNGTINLDSRITCFIKPAFKLQDSIVRITVAQLCNLKMVNNITCVYSRRCSLRVIACRDNERIDIKCEDFYTPLKHFISIYNLKLKGTMTKTFLNHEGHTINQDDALTVSETVTCQMEDYNNIIAVVTIKQICNTNINEIRHCSDQSKCTLLLRGTIGTMKCRLECSVTIKKHYSEISLQNKALLYQIRVAYPFATSPIVDLQGTLLQNNDVIHVNDTLLTCSLKLLNGTVPRHVPRTKFRLKFITQCSSIVKSIECTSMYGCTASIAHCQFLDRVHVTCAEYYSEKINKMVLHRRIDGAWGQWWPWTNWNPPCGRNSTRLKTRKCDSPYPRNGGNYCPGSPVFRETQKLQNCSDGAHAAVWGTWSDWSPCSLSCNTGITVRRRQCLSTKPASSDELCVGLSEIREFCFIISCAEHRKKVSIRLLVSILLGVGTTITVSFLIYFYFCKTKSKTEMVNSDEVIAVELLYVPTLSYIKSIESKRTN